MVTKGNNSITEYLDGIVKNLPEKPGCYQYLNKEGTIIYVGKAKNLKRRVSSYFNKEQESLKTRLLVRRIVDIRYIVVNSEEDALLLENSLIKKYKPHYNVLLKDDKTYPSICITNEYFPRIFKTRKIINGAGTYFGPYSNVGAMFALLELIKQLYPLRNCKLNITEKNIEDKKFKVCLEYHLKKCKAPCIGNIKHEEYMSNISEIKEILNGNLKEIIRSLTDKMRQFAGKMKFEEAQNIKNRIQIIESYRVKSEVVNSAIDNVDVFSITSDENSAYINYLHISKGAINQAFTFEYKKKLNESDEDLLTWGIVEMRDRYRSKSKEIIVPLPIELPIEGVTTTVPQKGEKKKLLDLSSLNVKQYKFDRLKQAEKLNPEQKIVRLMKEIQNDLKLDKIPLQIDCYDISNIAGSDNVGVCIVFQKLKPAKSEYRKYIIKSVEGADDYASMREITRRRYSRMVEEDTPLPNLLITDGGKGQMEAVREVIEDELGLNIPIAGLVKDNKHRTREMLIGFPPMTIGLKQQSALFRFMTQMQDEVHRFAISFHRDKRSKRQIASELDSIKGIGEKTKELLLKSFKSVKRIKEANLEELKAIVGKAKAELVYNGLKTL